MNKRVPPLRPEQTRWFLEHPKAFKINKMEANEMKQSDGSIIAKIPQIKDRIRIDDDGAVRLITGRKKNEETGDIQEETVTIGSDISNILQGMMYAEEVYRDYFNSFGDLINDPLGKQEAAEKRSSADKEIPEEFSHYDKPLPGLEERLKARVAEELRENNKVQVGGVELVRIPDIQGIRILPPNQQGNSLVEYVRDQWYDPVKKQSRNKKSKIGQASNEYPGAMIPNESYFRLFDSRTGLPYGYETPEEKERRRKIIEKVIENAKEFSREREKERLQKEENERLKELYGENSQEAADAARMRIAAIISKSYDEDPDTCDDDSDIEDGENPGTDETDAKENAETNETDNNEGKEDIQMLYDQMNLEQERPNVLRIILQSISQSISEQAKKHPNDIINVYKARKINDILIEIRVRYQGSGYEDLLELIREPEEVEKDGKKYLTGMTYSDAEILLSHYYTVQEYIKLKSKK